MSLRLVLLLLLSMIVSPANNRAVAAEKTAAERKSPNVVMIISDDQSWNDFGFMGHDAIKTPHLDRLASQSMVFPRGYVPTSLCRPSLATLATGLYPHQHKITGNDPPKSQDRNVMLKHIGAVPTLPRLLATRDYISLQTGKWWEGNHRLGGFTHGMTHGDTHRGGRHGDKGLEIGRKGLAPIFDFIDDRGDAPFFVWYAPFLPHSPHNPPAKYLKKYQTAGRSPHVAKYYAMCEWFDQTCGDLLAGLDQRGLSDNTLVVFVTDNGWIQQKNSGKYAPRSKRSPNEGGIRTPIMLRWPGHIKAGTNQSPVNSIDLVPTILAACSLEATEQMPGVNLLNVRGNELINRQAIFGEILAHDIADIDDPLASLQYRWCIEGNWKLIVPQGEKGDVERRELYDLKSDPWENNNLAAKESDVVGRLQGRIDRWWPEAK